MWKNILNLLILPTHGNRTLTMANRTTTIRTTTTMSEVSAKEDFHKITLTELLRAYYDCRKNKRNTINALNFEINLEENIFKLYKDLKNNNYEIGKSICFVVTHPKPREVWAADFRDRIVQHLVYNRVKEKFHNRFSIESCACIPGRGTLYGIKRLEKHIKSITKNWTEDYYYMKCDLYSFFMEIDKNVLDYLLKRDIKNEETLKLFLQILWHDPRNNVIYKSSESERNLTQKHKRLCNCKNFCGLAIGNLTSQFLANLLLNELDYFIKQDLKCKYYIRYVDDFVLLSKSANELNSFKEKIINKLKELKLQLNLKKTYINKIKQGITFIGWKVKPWRTLLKIKTINRIFFICKNSFKFETLNSYFGLLRQSNKQFNNRMILGYLCLMNGIKTDKNLTKVLI